MDNYYKGGKKEMEDITYSDATNTLKNCLNNRINKNSVIEFKTTLVFIKNVYGVKLSTRFLRNLIDNNKTTQQKSDIVRKIRQRADIKTEPSNRYFKVYTGNGTIYTKEVLNFLIV